ncbi:CLUMA_CG006645, isoform A [Clunio marinus]|uniref:CLUMA_CG006645, isoform A n=1 Tax=Clunio marinus TaxID=568069 RepID=A0A1J1HYM4_9DIPT|nr:CLUMA_CG006645, isoform A [Clunio marinus]
MRRNKIAIDVIDRKKNKALSMVRETPLPSILARNKNPHPISVTLVKHIANNNTPRNLCNRNNVLLENKHVSL